LPTPAAEQLLIEALPEASPCSILCTSLGRGQAALAASARWPAAAVDCVFLDLYHARQARSFAAGRAQTPRILCAADFPCGPYELALLPVDRKGCAELARDQLQQACARLAEQGLLMAAVARTDDQWLGAELKRLFPRVGRRAGPAGVLYSARRAGPLPKLKNFTCQFAFRDRGRLVHAISRPGVFSHRRLDSGTRALIGQMQVAPGARVLDLGCGSGAVGLAAALRAAAVYVLAVDSNARAVDCASRGVALNQRERFDVLLDDDGGGIPQRSFDLVVANPPYYSGYRIAEHFIDVSRRAIGPGGTALFVTRSADWFVERLRRHFAWIRQTTSRGYAVVEARN